jgi:hypothetical protein
VSGDDDHVLAGLDHLVQIAYRASPCGERQRAVLPHRLPTMDQISPGEIARGEVVVTGDGHQGTGQAPGHVLDKPGLATAGRPLEHDRGTIRVRSFEQGDLLAYRQIEGRLRAGISQSLFGREGHRARQVVRNALRHRHHASVGAMSARPSGHRATARSRRGARIKKS